MVIALQYRLAVMGFLYFPEPEEGQKYSGNWGIQDQTIALEWGNKYAPHFGGDISERTITGCSAGGMSVFLHLTIEDSWPYFDRAVPTGIGLILSDSKEVGTV